MRNQRDAQRVVTLAKGGLWRLGLLTATLGFLLAAEAASGANDRGPRPEKGDLTRAIIRGDEVAVRDLLRRGADPNENLGSTDAPITPLLAAMSLDEEKIAQVL
jgi:hypothetical protein